MSWFDFFKSKLPQVAVFLLIVSLYLMNFWLWKLPLMALLNSTLLALILFVIYLSSSYFRWRVMQKRLQDLELENEHLSHALKQEELANKEANDLLRVWSHQMKVPLAAIDLMTQTERAIDPLELKSQVFQLENYLNMLLETIKIQNLSNDFRFESVEVGAVCRELLKKYAAFFIAKNLKAEVSGTWVLITDRRWLSLALEQLINNAVKYTTTGGITLQLGPDSLTLTDSGVGILAEDLPRLFDHGFTGFNGRSHEKSSGLGLYLVKLILDKLDLQIEISSKINQGTKVLIRK